MSHTPKLVTKKKIKLEDKIDLTCILPKKYPTPLIIIKERYTKKLIKEIPIIKSDINTIESKHTGKYLAHVFYDAGQVSALVSSGILNLMKDSLTLIVLVSLMFYQKLRKDLGD